jgi:integrase
MANTPRPGTPRARRGWRERIEGGIYRNHRTACASSRDQQAGRRCGCAYSVAAPASGGTRWVTVDGSLLDARKIRAQIQSSAGTIAETPAGQDEALCSFATRWLRTRSTDLRPATMAIYERAYRVRIDPHLGGRRMAELTRSRVQEWVSMLLRTDPSRRQVEQAVEMLSSMLTAAVQDSILPTNPARGLRMPRPPATQRRAENVLTREQTERVIAKAGSLRNETMLRVFVEAGLRRGEVIGLRWPQVDLAARRIVVARSVWQGKKGTRVDHLPKGGKAHPAAISPDLASRLDEWFRESVIDGGAPADGLVWPGRDGRPLAATTVVRLVSKALKRAGVTDAVGGALVSAHGLRHTAASTALEAGVSLLVVSRQLGHSNQIITAQHYSHLLADEQLDAFATAQGRRSEEAIVE